MKLGKLTFTEEDFKEAIKQAHMSGQADAGVDPSYSNAQAYFKNTFLFIKDCPFCESKCTVQPTTFGDDPTESYRVECGSGHQHSLDHWEDTEIDAVKVWNQRP